MSAGIHHVIICSSNPPDRNDMKMSIPTAVPSDYSSLIGVPCSAIYDRVQILTYFSNCIVSSWKLYNNKTSQSSDEFSMFHVNPLSDGRVRHLISRNLVEGLMSSAIGETMNSKSHGPSVIVHRIAKELVNCYIEYARTMYFCSNQPVTPVFAQLAAQLLSVPPDNLKCSQRAWKVTLVGEGADDAGGVFDESIAQMCEVSRPLSV